MDKLLDINASNDAVIEYLVKNFGDRQEPPQQYVDELSDNLGAIRLRGQPIDEEQTRLFLYTYEKCENGSTIEQAIKEGMDTYPDARPIGRSKNGADDGRDFDTLRRHYFRFKERYHPLLNSLKKYNQNDLYWCVVIKQWDYAAAIFTKSTNEQRMVISKRLGDIIANR